MYQLNDQIIEDQTLDFPADDRVYLGHNLVLRRCRLHFASKWRDSVTAAKVRLEACEVHADKPLRGVDWTCAEFIDCVFHGTFQDSRFGLWPEHTSRLGVQGTIEGGDFRHAELHLCEFFGPSFESLDLSLPSWPCFTCVTPKRFFSALGQRSDLPAWAKWWVAIDGRSAELADASQAAMSYHAPDLVKFISRDVPCTEDDVRALLATADHVVM